MKYLHVETITLFDGGIICQTGTGSSGRLRVRIVEIRSEFIKRSIKDFGSIVNGLPERKVA